MGPWERERPMGTQSDATGWHSGQSPRKAPVGTGYPHSHRDIPRWHRAGVTFPPSGFGSSVSQFGAAPHPARALIAATSKLSYVSYTIPASGTLQFSSPWLLVELLTPNRDGRGANPRRSTSLPCFGGPPPRAPACVLDGGTWAMEGSSPVPPDLCPCWAGDRKVAPRGPHPHQGVPNSS